MRVLVCGGRDFRDTDAVVAALDAIHTKTPISVIVEGGASGADRIGRFWGYSRHVRVESYPADWKTHGNRAGPLRNKQMLKEGKPDLVIGFPGGKGTENMLSQARKAGVPVKRIGSMGLVEEDAPFKTKKAALAEAERMAETLGFAWVPSAEKTAFGGWWMPIVTRGRCLIRMAENARTYRATITSAVEIHGEWCNTPKEALASATFCGVNLAAALIGDIMKLR